jgi:hypothetical protein
MAELPETPGMTTSGDRAVADAAARAAGTRELNIDSVPSLPVPADTTNVRLGPEIDSACLALLPMVGIWRGTGRFGNDPGERAPQFGQQITVSHDGRAFLRFESVMWSLDADGAVSGPGAREVGWLRPQKGGTIELLLTHAEGRIEVFYGRAESLTSWALSTDAVWRTPSGPAVIGATRLYGITGDGKLAYVEERALADEELAPYASAALDRIAG